MCELCNQRVMLREMAAHRQMNCSIAKPDSVDVRPKEANVKPKPVYYNGELNYGIGRRGVLCSLHFLRLWRRRHLLLEVKQHPDWRCCMVAYSDPRPGIQYSHLVMSLGSGEGASESGPQWGLRPSPDHFQCSNVHSVAKLMYMYW